MLLVLDDSNQGTCQWILERASTRLCYYLVRYGICPCMIYGVLLYLWIWLTLVTSLVVTNRFEYDEFYLSQRLLCIYTGSQALPMTLVAQPHLCYLLTMFEFAVSTYRCMIYSLMQVHFSLFYFMKAVYLPLSQVWGECQLLPTSPAASQTIIFKSLIFYAIDIIIARKT